MSYKKVIYKLLAPLTGRVAKMHKNAKGPATKRRGIRGATAHLIKNVDSELEGIVVAYHTWLARQVDSGRVMLRHRRIEQDLLGLFGLKLQKSLRACSGLLLAKHKLDLAFLNFCLKKDLPKDYFELLFNEILGSPFAILPDRSQQEGLPWP